jgi:hypothetical protein
MERGLLFCLLGPELAGLIFKIAGKESKKILRFRPVF